MKRVFIIVGPECSGNHIVKRLFIEAGCFGTYDYFQQLDDFLFKKRSLKDITDADDIVHGDSMPARMTEFTDWVECAIRYEKEGYEVYWVIPIRDFLCLSSSKIDRGMLREKNYIKQIQKEYTEIFKQILEHGGHFWLLPMTILFEYPKHIIAEMDKLYGLEVPEKMIDKIYDANEKHREGGGA